MAADSIPCHENSIVDAIDGNKNDRFRKPRRPDNLKADGQFSSKVDEAGSSGNSGL
jgi:hypothetical protein